MGTYIVIDDATGIIDNRIEMEAGSNWPVPAGHSIVEEAGTPMQIGGTWIGGVYTPPPPIPPEPLPEPVTSVPDANARIDAGVMAAITAAEDVRDSIHAIPQQFNAVNFQQFLLQAKILSDAFVAMLAAQAALAPPP